MIKRIAIIWLVGLFFLNSVSGSFMVICHGADGHVALEPVFHGHCDCPETDPQENPVSIGSYCLDEHGRCQDFVFGSGLVVPSKNTARQSIEQLFTSCFVHHADSLIHISFSSHFYSQGDHLPAFYTPLRTVILLA